MSGKTHHVNSHFLHINVEHSRRLGCVQHKEKAMAAADTAHCLHINHISRQIGGVGADNHLRIRTDCLLKLLRRNLPAALRLQRKNRQTDSQILHPVKGTQNRIVLHHCGDHMISRFQHALYGYI